MDTHILLDLYRLARENPPDDFPVRALALLQHHLPFDSGRWLRSTYTAPQSIRVHEAHLFNDTPEMLKAHEQVIDLNAPNWKAVRSPVLGPIGFAYNSAATFGGAESAQMRDYQRRFAHENTLNVLVKRRVDAQTHYRMIALHRARADRTFSAGDVARMRTLLPHFVEALAINGVIGQVSRAARGTSFSAGIADVDRTLLFAEPRLRELLQAAWPASDPGKVPVALWDALAREGVYADEAIVAVSGPSHGMVFVRVRSRCPADALSPRELEAARLDAAGLTYKEIARRMGTAPATARNALQRVHGKLCARNRGELAQSLQLLD